MTRFDLYIAPAITVLAWLSAIWLGVVFLVAVRAWRVE